MDNQNVVSYCPYLSLKYNAHINVEVCTSSRAIKYIYKYIYKGFDCTNIVITAGSQREMQYSKIQNYIDARYLSAPEAMWRLLESLMHDRSHTVMRLPVHLPNQQRIIFAAGREDETLLAAQTGRTKLESWFHLNTNDADANKLLYTDIPLHFVYVKGNWKQRKRGGQKIVVRMYTVSPKDEELFYLRLLLLHVLDATSFESLRTLNEIVYQTFKEAAWQHGLLESDTEWIQCLSEASTYQMPKQMRETFAFICCFCQPSKPMDLWNDFKDDMILDYLRQNDASAAMDSALHDINTILKQHGLSCAQIDLPTPSGNAPFEQDYNAILEQIDAAERIATLNPNQLQFFNQIITAVDDDNLQHGMQDASRCFYWDGPGGSGKTFLYSTLMAFVRGRGQRVLAFATTGIAATLMKGGRTVHSGFKLPVPLLDTSVSSMRVTSPEAEVMRQAVLIIIEEITMLSKHGLRCINNLLQEICTNKQPFGGKVVVGGDFRQTLPVVARGTRVDIIECCVKSSRLWQHFTTLSLTTNMRSEGEDEHNTWLLSIGSGNIQPIHALHNEDIIQIPSTMFNDGDLIKSVYGEDIQNMPVDELAKRVILAPTNQQILDMNRNIIDMLPGEPFIYYSADSVVSEDPSDALTFPPEFLHEQAPSGMPPHVLVLKEGVIIMLLRNLNPKKGLCNGTRMIVRALYHHTIRAEIMSECNRGDTVLIPRIDLAPSDTLLPFTLKRRQFPITPAYAMTINKSQGQTFDHVGIYLNTPVFSHDQLYVALSRSRKSHHVKVRIHENHQQGQLLQDGKQFTINVVFKEIFDMFKINEE